MTRRSIDLATPTPRDWVAVILDDFDTFLQDHANCERKASALAMSLVVKYPDRDRIVPRLIALAQEELEHFRQVYEVLAARGLPLVGDIKDPYVNRLLALMRTGREERFLDRMLVSSIIECRGAERFGLIAEALGDGDLKTFYEGLYKAERKHGHQFVDMVLEYYEPQDVYPRLQELTEEEGSIIATLDWRPSLH